MPKHGLDHLMKIDGTNSSSESQLTLRSQMADLALVPAWIEHLASEYAISPSTEFAMNLCLEEVLSNIIRHGYNGKPGLIQIRYEPTENKSCLLVVDDEAPHFNPLAATASSIEGALDGTRIGGLGIRLLRNFSATLMYEPTAAGNRLTIGFAAQD
jgi:serine/threonine-protein kinase RsbW